MYSRSNVSARSIRLDSSPLTLRVAAISELELFLVGASESPNADKLNRNDSGTGKVPEVDWVESEETRLKAVSEWHKNEVSESQHEAETVGGNIHLGQNGRLL